MHFLISRRKDTRRRQKRRKQSTAVQSRWVCDL